MAETRTCPFCQNAIVVRVGIIEKHLQSHGPKYVGQHGRSPRVEWCAASGKRWEGLAKQSR